MIRRSSKEETWPRRNLVGKITCCVQDFSEIKSISGRPNETSEEEALGQSMLGALKSPVISRWVKGDISARTFSWLINSWFSTAPHCGGRYTTPSSNVTVLQS